MKVFVIGGTGAVGQHAVNALVDSGHDLTVIVRSTEKAKALESLGIQTSQVSIFDRAALTDAFQEFMLSSAWKVNTMVRTEGSAAISGAAMDAGAERLIQESVCMLYPDGGSNWLDETIPPDRFLMAEANLAAEDSVARFTLSGGIGIVLRFGWFYGPGATHSEQFLKMARSHFCVQMGRADTYVSSIFMSDAGSAVAAALEAPSGIYNITDDNPLTKREYADALGEASGSKWWFRVPGAAALLLGNRSTSLTRSIRASNEKFKRATNWQPRYPSAREGWAKLASIQDP